MDATDHHPDDSGPDAAPETPPTRKLRGADPLSQRHRRKLLAALRAAADAGDTGAMKTLLELGAAAQRDERLAKSLERINAAESGDE